MKNITKNICVILCLVIILLSFSSNAIFAVTKINEAYLVKIGDADYHLKHYNQNKGTYTYITVSIVGYYNNGKFYPAYCTNKDLNGVRDIGSYYVDTNSYLNNNQVWRAIKNGYPYKTATQMGLSSDFDAYVVTKMAVYCLLGQSNINDFSADSSDIEAVNMLNALKDLVNIGLNGSEIYKESVNVNKNGTLKKDGEYYSQEYKVTSNSVVSKYDIKSVNSFPEGTIITDSNDNIKTTFSSGEIFKVKIPTLKMNKNINGKIEVETEIKNYPMYNGKARVGGAQDCVVTADYYSNIISEVELNEKANTGKIVINKIDSETKKGINGVGFQLLDANNTVLESSETNENGVLEFSELFQGSYKVKETKANDNYIMDNTEREVQVKYNDVTTLTMENEHKKGDLKVNKLDKENTKIALGNVEFDLYSTEFDKVIGTYFTDANGEIFVSNLRTGNYKLIEKSTNRWYDLAGDTEVKVKWNEISENTVYNELKKGKIKIIKYDKENENIRLQGVTFNVLNSKGEVIQELVTNEKGEAESNWIPINETYTVKEIKTLDYYIPNEDIVEVVLKSKEVKELVFTNERMKSKIKVIKQDKDNSNIKIPGVVFNILDGEGNVIETLTTDEKGEAESLLLPLNEKYIISEVSTANGYEINNKQTEVILNSQDTKEIIVTNEKMKGQLKIIKHDLDNNEIKLQGVKFNILDPNGQIVQELITNENGEAVSENYPIDQEYTVIETETLEDYVLDNKPINVELNSNEITEIILSNEKIKGQIAVTKISRDDNRITGDKKGQPLQGVKFNILDLNGNVIDILETDENGKAISKRLEKGTYKLKEILTKEGYLLDNKTYEININENNEIKTITLKNTPEDPAIDIDKTGPDEANVGDEIEYKINVKNSGNVKLSNFKWQDTIDTNYIHLNKIKTGTYDQKVNYNIYYKTNLSNNKEILIMEDLDSTQNYEIDFNKELSDNEYVIEIILDFRDVDVGFSNKDETILYASIHENVKSEETFINEAKVMASYKELAIEDISKWKTICYKILPKTGF